jgi:DNA repair exonuclease SbcCD ATPase subunit
MYFDLSEECRQLKHQLEQAKSNYDNSFSDMATQYKQTIARLVKENDYLQEMIAQQARTIDTINLKLVNEQAMNRQYEKELATLKQMIQKEKTRGAIEKDNLRTSIKLLSTENKKLVDKYNKAKIELKERDQVTIEMLPTFVNTPPPKPSKRRPSTAKKVIGVKKEISIVKKEVSIRAQSTATPYRNFHFKALHSISDDEDHSGPADYDVVPVKKEAKRK